MERIMKTNDWDHNVERDVAEGPVDCVCRDVIRHFVHKM